MFPSGCSETFYLHVYFTTGYKIFFYLCNQFFDVTRSGFQFRHTVNSALTWCGRIGTCILLSSKWLNISFQISSNSACFKQRDFRYFCRGCKIKISKLLIIGQIAYIDIQGLSRETDVFEINITPLIFSAEFIYYHEMIRYYAPFCVRFVVLYFRPFPIRQHVAEQNGLDSSLWPLSLFPRSPGFVQLRQDQVVFFFIIVPLVRKDVTHLKMVLRLGMFSWRPIIETATKEPLSFNNRFATFYETVVCKHTML